jgi:hypothetical protein
LANRLFYPILPLTKWFNQEEDMGYKKVDKTISFAEVCLIESMENNRSVKMMERIEGN